MIYEYFLAPERMKPFRKRLQNHDVQDFVTRWDQAPLAASEIPTEMILEGLCKSKLQDSVQFQTVFVLYDQETVRNNGQPSYSEIEGICETSY